MFNEDSEELELVLLLQLVPSRDDRRGVDDFQRDVNFGGTLCTVDEEDELEFEFVGDDASSVEDDDASGDTERIALDSDDDDDDDEVERGEGDLDACERCEQSLPLV